jgi:hypothetical protein
MTYKTMGAFLGACNYPARVVKAVINKLGGWECFKETAKDVAEHGADSGFSGFTYYADTCAFYANHQTGEIVKMVTEMAEELGEGAIEMVRNFNCLGKEYSDEEVGQTLYGSKAKHNTQVANALAWFALEEVCRAFVNE